MPDSSQPDNDHAQPQHVNLQEIAQQFMVGLQRHFDMLAFNLAARKDVTEVDYDRIVHAPRIMPAVKSHQNFEQMQAYARDLLVRQVIGDSVNLTITAMNNAHFFLALVKATKARNKVEPEEQKQAQQWQKAFVAAPLDQKFNTLENEYGIMCELEDSIVSLGFCMQALMKQRGIVEEAQLDSNGEIELKALKVMNRGAESGQIKGKLVDQQKRFVRGDAIVFSDMELQLVLVTIASFADGLFKSVSHFAKSRGGEGV